MILVEAAGLDGRIPVVMGMAAKKSNQKSRLLSAIPNLKLGKPKIECFKPQTIHE